MVHSSNYRNEERFAGLNFRVFNSFQQNFSREHKHFSLIKTHGCVSVTKKAVWHTSMLFTETANSPFSTPCISITLGLIYIKFTYFMSSIYMTLHTKCEENQPSSLWDMCSWKFPYFLHIFHDLLLCTILQK